MCKGFLKGADEEESPLSSDRIELGRLGEKLARKEIRRLGYRKIEKNYRCPMGEIDMVARDGSTLVFIETKTRRGLDTALPKEAVNASKRKQLSKLALAYMKAHDCCEASARFDVVAVCIGEGKPKIEVIRNAFDLEYESS